MRISRFVRAFWRLARAPAKPPPSGPLAIDRFDVTMELRSRAPCIAAIYYPAEGCPPPALESTLTSYFKATRARHLSHTQPRFSILLYAPGNGNSRDDNASTCAAIASHGYVIIAIDDIDRDAPDRGAQSLLRARPLVFDFSSKNAFERTLAHSSCKAWLEADKALAALDGLLQSASSEWRARLDFERVGFFGFSMGGAAAAEAGVIDDRIAAVANLDGWLFGRAAEGALTKPFLVMNSDFHIPDERTLSSRAPRKRYEAMLTTCTLREHVRLANRPDGYWVWVKGSTHTGFCDQIFARRSVLSWAALDPDRMKEIRDAYLVAFFNEHLRGIESPLLRRSPSPFHEVELLAESAQRLAVLNNIPARQSRPM